MPDPEATPPEDDSGLQKTIRADLGLLPAAILSSLGGAMQRRVCRVELNDTKALMGTGFLVGPDALLTAFHVVAPTLGPPDKRQADPAMLVCRFDYQFRPNGSTTDGVVVGLAGAADAARPWLLASAPYSPGEATGSPDDPRPTTDELDFALVRLARRVGDEVGADGTPRGWVEVPANPPAVNGESFLIILQHPSRMPLHVALNTDAKSRLVHAGLRVRYEANSEAGASGSPVFDRYLKLLALHHYGDPSWDRPKYNQGVPIGLIREKLRGTPAALAALGGDPDAAARLGQLAAQVSAAVAAPGAGLSELARQVIGDGIEKAGREWKQAVAAAADPSPATDRYVGAICRLLTNARKVNGDDLPPDWQKVWDDLNCDEPPEERPDPLPGVVAEVKRFAAKFQARECWFQYLNAYKGLHLLLHELNGSVEKIRGEADARSRDGTPVSVETVAALEAWVTEAAALWRETQLPDQPAPWVAALARAADKFLGADPNLQDEGMDALASLPAANLLELNFSLLNCARSLDAEELQTDAAAVRDAIHAAGAATPELRALAAAADAFRDPCGRLLRAIQHDTWCQQIDNQFRAGRGLMVTTPNRMSGWKSVIVPHLDALVRELPGNPKVVAVKDAKDAFVAGPSADTFGRLLEAFDQLFQAMDVALHLVTSKLLVAATGLGKKLGRF